MFLSTNMTNTVQALDARTGDLIWEHRLGPIGTTGQNATRTMALYGNLVFYPATDATLYALDARNGNIVWKEKVGPNPDDKIGGIMMAKDKLLVGLTRCNELDARDHCFIAGYDASSGKQLWKFYTVARQGTPGGDTWGPLPDDRRSGADAWIAGTYDPQLNLALLGHRPGKRFEPRSTRSKRRCPVLEHHARAQSRYRRAEVVLPERAGRNARSRRSLRARADRPRSAENGDDRGEVRPDVEAGPRDRQVPRREGNSLPERVGVDRHEDRPDDVSRRHPREEAGPGRGVVSEPVGRPQLAGHELRPVQRFAAASRSARTA